MHRRGLDVHQHRVFGFDSFRAHAHELACVIAEPVLGSMGMVPATREFLQVLREETEAAGIVFILFAVILGAFFFALSQGYIG